MKIVRKILVGVVFGLIYLLIPLVGVTVTGIGVGTDNQVLVWFGVAITVAVGLIFGRK